ncbi:hypothetical protein FS749_011251 [Ceratobasidium sp. UAMH 11750]|nr:hypothetical protein FS749_011251 [Ceratobasidium sp. UAMH 11750]
MSRLARTRGDLIQVSATVYLDRNNNFAAAVLDTSPKKKRFTAVGLNRDPGETSTSIDLNSLPDDTSTDDDNKELSGRVSIWNDPSVAVPGKVDKFTMRLGPEDIWVDIGGDEIRPNTPVAIWVDIFETDNLPQHGRGTWTEV